MPQNQKNQRPKRIRRSIKMDRVKAADFNKYHFIYCCEQCCHFDSYGEVCSIAYPSYLHRKEAQLKKFQTSGHMALCRFIEID